MPLFELNTQYPVSCRIKLPTRSVATGITGGGVTVRPRNRQYIRTYSVAYEIDNANEQSLRDWLFENEGKRIRFWLPGSGGYQLRTGILTKAIFSSAISAMAKRFEFEVEVH